MLHGTKFSKRKRCILGKFYVHVLCVHSCTAQLCSDVPCITCTIVVVLYTLAKATAYNDGAVTGVSHTLRVLVETRKPFRVNTLRKLIIYSVTSSFFFLVDHGFSLCELFQEKN